MDIQKTEQLISEMIKQKLDALLFTNGNLTPYHTHNSIDGTPQLDPSNFLPFTIYSAIPTDTANNGTMKIVYDGVNYRVYFRVNNLWKYVNLT